MAFDVVSCQFAAHYFFKNAETLGNFCGIVGSRLRKGGYFVCTCMDADLIVSGAYGHSRAYEWVLGGVTRHLLHACERFVFLSH